MNIIDELHRIIAPDIAELKESVRGVKDNISDLKEDLRQLRKELNALSNEVAGLKGRYEGIEETIIIKIKNQFLKALAYKSKGFLRKK